MRPCLVLSEAFGEDILLCQITSQKITGDKYNIPLLQEETQNGALAFDSFIRPNKLFTGEEKSIIKVLCNISEEKYDDVTHKIAEIIS